MTEDIVYFVAEHIDFSSELQLKNFHDFVVELIHSFLYSLRWVFTAESAWR